jgi:hypothetical protein
MWVMGAWVVVHGGCGRGVVVVLVVVVVVGVGWWWWCGWVGGGGGGVVVVVVACGFVVWLEWYCRRFALCHRFIALAGSLEFPCIGERSL